MRLTGVRIAGSGNISEIRKKLNQNLYKSLEMGK